MDIEKITYKLISDTLEKGEITPFLIKMMISYLTDEQRGTILDEIVNEKQSIEFKQHDEIWFDPKDNMYDLKDILEDDIMLDSLLMTKGGYIKAIIIDDNSYGRGCSSYATEYKVHVQYITEVGGKNEYKEIRIKRSNIMGLWKPLE